MRLRVQAVCDGSRAYRDEVRCCEDERGDEPLRNRAGWLSASSGDDPDVERLLLGTLVLAAMDHAHARIARELLETEQRAVGREPCDRHATFSTVSRAVCGRVEPTVAYDQRTAGRHAGTKAVPVGFS